VERSAGKLLGHFLLMTVKHIEIERKFLVKTMPDLSHAQKVYIHQGYITHSNDSVEVRLRQKDEQYFITVKSGSGMVRNEHEISIDQQQFETLWPETEGKRIEKHRWTGRLNEQTFELDIFTGDLKSLVLVEVEFSSAKEADNFEPTDWFGREVTADKRYKNKSLAMNPHAVEAE
jgi:CYTH domain-containing protein